MISIFAIKFLGYAHAQNAPGIGDLCYLYEGGYGPPGIALRTTGYIGDVTFFDSRRQAETLLKDLHESEENYSIVEFKQI